MITISNYICTNGTLINLDELSHHGILGMKWGKRNGPPYPLGPGDHSEKEKKTLKKYSFGRKKEYEERKNTTNRVEKSKQKTKKSDDNSTPKPEKPNKNQNGFKKESPEIKITSKDSKDFRSEMINRYSNDKSKTDFYKNASDAEIRSDIMRKQNTKRTIATIAAVAGIGVAVGFAYKYHCMKKMKSLGKLDVDIKDLKKIDVLGDIAKETLEDISVVLDPGSVMHRMVGTPDFDINKADDILYTSFKKGDVNAYKALLKDWSGTGKRFDVELEVTSKIKAPTKDKAREIFEELWKTNPQYQKDLRETLFKTYTSLYPQESRQTITDHIDFLMAQDPFQQGIYALVRSGNDSKTLRGEYLKRGFTALEDYFDKDVLAESPLILLDPKNTVVKKGEKFVSARDKAMAVKELAGMEDHPATKGSMLWLYRTSSIEDILKDFRGVF